MYEFYESLRNKKLTYWVCKDVDRVVFMTAGGFSTRYSTVEKFLLELENVYEGSSNELRIIEELDTFIKENS